MYVHGLYVCNNVCLNLQKFHGGRVYILVATDVFTEATKYSDYSKGGEPVDITDSLLPQP